MLDMLDFNFVSQIQLVINIDTYVNIRVHFNLYFNFSMLHFVSPFLVLIRHMKLCNFHHSQP